MAPPAANGASHGDSSNGAVVADRGAAPAVANGNGKQHNGRTRTKPAVNPKDKYWTPIDDKEAAAAVEDGGEDGRRPLLFRTFKVKAILLLPYRHPYADGMWLWWISIVGDFWFGVTWLLNQVAKLSPIKCDPDLAVLKQQFDLPDGNSNLPGLDVFINTVDPINEPMIYTMNAILSILAVDYPVDRHATYLSDDGGSIIHYDGLLETARLMSKEYDEFKVRLDALFTKIPQRSEAYNNAEAKQGDEPQVGQPASANNSLDFSEVDVRLPMLVYISREKNPSYDHQKKAGAMNVQLRVSALLTNAPFIINFDGDHYVNNSQAFRAAMCFMLDRRDGDNTAFVQFPQRFDDVDPTDRYCNHNRVFFDATLLGLNGIQGPSYVGTGCMFRRVAIYGVDPPRWRPDNAKIVDNPSKFGNSVPFINSIPTAANQEWSKTSPPALDETFMAELSNVMSCAYEEGTVFGKEVGWVYNIATEDVVTGFRLHRTGWRSMYCRIEPDAFRGTAPINLTERLYQILRWSGGSLEMFFSYCPLFASRRLKFMQRVAYTNMTAYPISSIFLVFYLLFPVIWIFRGEFYIQKPFPTYVLYLVIVIAMTELIGMVEIKWAGLTLLDWIRNEQFYIIGATAVYPMAVLHIVLKLVLRGKGVSFKMTSKQATSTVTEKFAELYMVEWVPLLIPTIVVIAVNVCAIGTAIGKAVVGGWSLLQMADAALGLVFNAWILVLIYPFLLGIMGRWSKRPYVLFILLVIAFILIAMVDIAIQAMRHGFVRFHFRESGGASFPTSWGF
ncbi:hypothetical protein PR202_ga29617 [Eleusine coracana subsp. coracana]|uniref:Uncharacterized protein n=1 Tax=Eleusine coracana subsp. coracana TaxID=191504 RepID=A0AAV5DLA0_ELECO|nr:hypothetical protein PR202_ga29617 [Eleusine coracana subsp. coracana]